MLSWFIRNRRGSITIMLSVVLIAVLSLSTTLIEIARYRSLERIFREVEDSAAFSVLSQYDRDLYKNFGLLAVSQDIGKEEFIGYMEKNLSGGGDDSQSSIDKLLKLTDDVEFDKLYDLAQDDVLRSQIMEFTALRAPAALVNNSLNLEELIGSLVKEFEKSIPMLNVFQSMLGFMDKLLDTCLKVQELGDASNSLKESKNEYGKDLKKYNDAVAARDEYMNARGDDEEDTEDSDETENDSQVSQEEYERVLKQKNDDVMACAVVVGTDLDNLGTNLANYYEKYQSFLNSFNAMGDADVNMVLSAAKTDYQKKSAEKDPVSHIATASAKEAEGMVDMLNSFETGYKSAEKQCDNICDAVGELHDTMISIAMNTMAAQKELLNQEPEQLSKLNEVNLEAGISNLWTAIEVVLKVGKFFTDLISGLWEGMSILTQVIEISDLLAQETPQNTTFNNVIDNMLMQSLAGHLNNGSMRKTENIHAQQDSETVASQIHKTENVAGKVGFDVNSLNVTDNTSENYALQNAMDKHYAALLRFQAAGREMKSWTNYILPINLIMNFIEAVRATIEYIGSCIEVCTVLIDALNSGGLVKLMYQRLNIASYASDMFSNCATDLGGDKRLNGSSYFSSFQTKASNGDCFDIANTEYIFSGGNNEYRNVDNVVMWMTIIRIFCNIPAVLSNQAVMNTVETLTATGVGFIVAIIIVAFVFIVEAEIDMLLLKIGRTSVDIIKTTGYLTMEGLKDLKEKLQNVFNSNDVAKAVLGLKENKEEPEKKEETVTEKWKNGLTEWDYKDHLFFMLLICKSSNQMLDRCADLIDMQMRKKKREKGELEPFQLKKMATFIRVDVSAEYQPVLPIPSVPGINDGTIPIRQTLYRGY